MPSTDALSSLGRSNPHLPVHSRLLRNDTEQVGFETALAAASEHANSNGISEKTGPTSAAPVDPQAPEFIGTRRLTDVDKAVYADIRKTFQLPEAASGDQLLLSGHLMVPWMFSGASGKAITDDLLTSNLEKATEIFRRHLGSWMSRDGIPTTPPIQLSVASDGRVVAPADHPAKDRIESFINGNEELRNLFVGITSTKSMIEIGRESAAFQARYAVDPKAAVAEYSHFFTGSYTYDTILSIGDSDWSLVSTPRWNIAG